MANKTPPTKHVLSLGDPPLYVLVDKPRPGSTWFGPSWIEAWHPVATVHVMSPNAGGEVRGYWLIDETLFLRLPAYPLDWPEVDAEIERVLGLKINTRREL